MPIKRSPRAESEEMATLARAVERSLAEGCAGLYHLSTPLGRANYLRKADTVKHLNPGGGRLLDWGCAIVGGSLDCLKDAACVLRFS